MNITSAKYNADPIQNINISITATIDDVKWFIPLDPANCHYAEIMRQVEAGTLTIQPADEPVQEEPPAT